MEHSTAPNPKPSQPPSSPAYPHGAAASGAGVWEAVPTTDLLAEAESLEWIERRAWQGIFCSAPRAVREALGLRTYEQGPLFGGFAPRVDVLALNRVLGLGQPPDSFSAVEAALDMGRRSGAARVFLPVLPGPVGSRVEARLEDQGIALRNHWVRLSLRLDQPFHAGYSGTREGRPEVRPFGREQAAAYGALAAEAFGMPEAAGALLAGPVGWPGWTHFGAWWNGEFAGAGAQYIEGSMAWLSFASVRAAFRGRGIHAALIGERLRMAREKGCAWVSVETADWSGGRPSGSMRNLLRFGFEPRYRRPNRMLIPVL